MTFNVLTIILIITVVVSFMAFGNRKLRDELMYIPYDVKHFHSYRRIFGHLLIHADYFHLGFNMFALYALGDLFLRVNANDYVGLDGGLIYYYGNLKGQIHFLTIYLGGGLFATLIPYIRNQNNISYKSLGASGAVSAVIFATILWNPSLPLGILFIPIAIPAYIFGPLYLLIEYYMDRRGGTGIAHDAHLGGALFGIVYVLIINIDKGKEFISYITG